MSIPGPGLGREPNAVALYTVSAPQRLDDQWDGLFWIGGLS